MKIAYSTLPLCLSVVATTLQAQNALEEVIVSAEFRDTALMKSGNSTSVLDQQLIRQRVAQHLEDMLNVAPNVNFAGGTSRARYFQIRGIGDRSQFQEPLNPSVGLLLDGVDFSGIGSLATLFDIEQVEVLRGPQGTLHGANALAGLINITSNAPSESFYNRIEASAADYSTRALGLVSSGPLSDHLLYRLAVQQYNSDGYQENDFLGDDDTQNRDELTARGRLRWLATERTGVDLSLNYVDLDNGYDAFSLDNTRTTLSDEPGRDTQKSLALGLQSSTAFDAFELRTALSYAGTDSDYGYDEDWTYRGFHADGYSSFDLYQRERDSVSAEILLLSNDNSAPFAGRSQWVAGLYYLSNREDLNRYYTYAADFTSEYDTQTLALFARLDTALNQRWTLVTGFRFENRNTDYADNNGVSFSPDKNLWGGKLALEYQWNNATLAYGSISRGYRANGINAGILASIDATGDADVIDTLNKVRSFDEETLLNYELGLKSTLWNNSLWLRAALFYMDRDDQQVRGSFLIPRDDGGTRFIDYTANAAEGENYGTEIEIDWLASEALHIWANLGLLDTGFEDYVNIFGEDLSGRAQAHAPQYQYAVGGRYDWSNGLFLRLEMEGRDAFYFSDRHSEQAHAYDLVNASLGMEREQWRLVLWGRNLGDEDYHVRGFGSFGNDPRKAYITEPYYQFGEPRMVGVSASYTF